MQNLFLAAIAFAIYTMWKLKGFLFVLMLVLLAGCGIVEETCHYDAWGDHHCTKTYYFDSPPPQSSTVYVVEEKKPEDTLIYIENSTEYMYTNNMSVYSWSYECGDLAYFTSPYDHDPSYCYHYGDHHVECDFWFGGTCFETWLWDDHTCEWVYLFDYCDY